MSRDLQLPNVPVSQLGQIEADRKVKMFCGNPFDVQKNVNEFLADKNFMRKVVGFNTCPVNDYNMCLTLMYLEAIQ